MPNSRNDDDNLTLSAPRRSLTRREWVQRMLAGAGAGAGMPALAEANWAVAADAQTTASSDKATEWKPAFLDEPQNATLVVLAERIVPGSTKAQVNRFIDTALLAMPQENQLKFVAALNAIEGEALRQFKRTFRELSPSQQDQVLTTSSAGKSTNPTLSASAESNHGVPPAEPRLRDYFEHLKGWVSMAYYSSEIGMKELGWDGESFYESYPGCDHPGGHA